jgi:FixJ family two-component response regulator
VSAARTALLERDDELEALRTWVRRLAAGEGRAVVIEGPAGIAAGRSTRDIAAELVVSVRTVEFHLTRAYGKLGISSREQLADGLGAESAPVD